VAAKIMHRIPDADLVQITKKNPPTTCLGVSENIYVSLAVP
jgi:hypothetical protein